MPRRSMLIAALLVAVAATTGGAARAGGPARFVVLEHNVLPGLAALRSSGPVAPSTVLHIGIGFQRPDPAAEAELYQAQYDPRSPRFHQFLTPAEFADRFGVDKATFVRAVAWLRRGGLTISHAGASRDYIQAVGTAENVERLFHTQLQRYRWNGTAFYANTAAPVIPADLPIMTVVGLNDWQRFHPAHPAHADAPAAEPSTDPLTPQDLWSIYEQPTENTGQGQTMAVFGVGRSSRVINDLRVFEKKYHLREIPVRVRNIGAGSFDTPYAETEWDIDMQAEQGMAPDALRMDLYFGNSLIDADVEAMFSAWVSDPIGPKQANASFSECETNPLNPLWYNPALDAVNVDGNPDAVAGHELGNNLEPLAEQTLRQGALQGQTLFASTGDTGSSCPAVVVPVAGVGNGIANQVIPLLGYPAASQYAVAAGGTVLFSDGGAPAQRFLERAWEYTGGGTSVFITAPKYQQGVSNVVGRCISDPSGAPNNTGQQCRGIPDVAAVSGDIVSSGYTIIDDGADSVGGGTSLSSPLLVGMWARMQAAAPSLNGNGLANESFYRIGADATKRARDYFDVTTGTNGMFTALPGWDYVSGWGVPRVANMMRDVDGKTTPTNNILPPALATVAVDAARPDPCLPLWIDPAGDDNETLLVALPNSAGKNPQLDLRSSTFQLSDDNKTLKVRLQVTNLSTTVPAPGIENDYFAQWVWNGVTYYANASVDVTGAKKFSDGIVGSGTPSRMKGHDDTGSFTLGANGIVEIDIPLANVGNPPAGARLGAPAGETDVFFGSPVRGVSPVSGLLARVDAAGPVRDYAVGATCPSAAAAGKPVPAVQAAAANRGRLPATGGAFPTAAVSTALLALASVLRRTRGRMQPRMRVR